ncbi:MAG: hypothetical protein RR548_08710 [Carnobacterium sp.]|uniref:hypothetical protein n=2 Tax=Carnobacterium sp. TaxID=48221 RepID=UPI002FC8471F
MDTIIGLLSLLVPIILIISVIQSIGGALLKQQASNSKTQGNKPRSKEVLAKYQTLKTEVEQETHRLRNTPAQQRNKAVQKETRAVKQQTTRTQRPARNYDQHITTKQSHHKSAQPLVTQHQLQTEAQDRERIAKTVSKDMQQKAKAFVQSEKRVNNQKKQVPFQKELLKAVVYKEIIDKPRAMRPYR